VITAAAPLLGVLPMDSIGEATADSGVLQPLGTQLINTLVKPHERKLPAEEPEELPSATVVEDN
jgi:hypothetical protein